MALKTPHGVSPDLLSDLLSSHPPFCLPHPAQKTSLLFPKYSRQAPAPGPLKEPGTFFHQYLHSLLLISLRSLLENHLLWALGA